MDILTKCLNPDYTSYLKLNELLSLQKPISNAGIDEHFFITVHQATELYFKLLLQYLEKIKSLFIVHDNLELIKEFGRCQQIFYNLAQQITLLTTMSPVDFLKIRSALGTSSGLQSIQFKAIEHVLGNKQAKFVLTKLKKGSTQYRILWNTFNEPSLRYFFYQFLRKKGVCIADEFIVKSCDDPDNFDSNTFDWNGLLNLYQNSSLYSYLFEIMINFDEAYVNWKSTHVNLVKRMVGNKVGTGGSTGLKYLEKKISWNVFPELWHMRNKL